MSFAEQVPLFGHQDILQDLLQKQAKGVLHHSLVLYGPEGVGKETLCRHIVHTILLNAAENAEQRQRVEAQILAESHPHILKIEPVYDDKKQRQKKDITLDSLKRMHDFLRLAPTENGPRFVIIKPADTMNINTQNAVLKILEEPPRDTYFFLLTERRHTLLPTIRSRTVEVAIKPLNDHDFKRGLSRLLPAAEDHEIDALATLSPGVLGQAVQIAQSEILQQHADACRAVLNMLEQDSRGAMEFAESLGSVDHDDVLANLISLWRERLAGRLKATLRGTAFPPLVPEEAQLLNLWQSWPQEKILATEQQIDQLWQRTHHAHLDRKLMLLSALRLLADLGNSSDHA